MFANLTGWHLLIIVAIVLLLFGATRLPALAKGVGQSVRILRHETAGLDEPLDPEGEASKPADRKVKKGPDDQHPPA